MNRVLKTLGVAMVAALAMSVVASAASAVEFTTEDGKYPATFHGENTAGSEVFTTEGGSVECDSTFSGEISEKSSTVEAHPEYSNCKAFGFVSATVNTEECNYLFHLNTEEAEHEFLASADVVCPNEGESIKITASTCAAEVGPQTGLEHVLFKVDTGTPNILTPFATVGGIKYTVTKDGFLCPFNGTGAKEGGEYNTEEGKAAAIEPSKQVHIG